MPTHRRRPRRYPFFRLPFFPCVFLCADFLCGFLLLPQPVTAIFVLVLISAPFCPTNSVGIASFVLQRFVFAPSAE